MKSAELSFIVLVPRFCVQVKPDLEVSMDLKVEVEDTYSAHLKQYEAFARETPLYAFLMVLPNHITGKQTAIVQHGPLLHAHDIVTNT